MNSEGRWAFAPAYDLTYTSNGYHQMLLGSKVLNRATFDDLKNAFKPYNIDELFLRENIQKMCELKQSSLVKECVNIGIPREFANTILEDIKIVDESFTKGLKS